MSVAITAYTGLTKAEDVDLDLDMLEEGEDINVILCDNYVTFYDNPDTVQRLAGLEVKVIYRYEAARRFSIGSFITYFDWREELTRLAGYSMSHIWMKSILFGDPLNPLAMGLPFSELFFCDCDSIEG